MVPILITTEQACVNYFTSASLSLGYTPESTVFIRTGIDNEDIKAPAVICRAASATEDFPYSGLYRVSTYITLKEMAGDTAQADIGTFSNNMFQSFIKPGIETLLANSTSSYYVLQVRIEDTENEINGDAWTQQYRFEIVCGLSGSL